MIDLTDDEARAAEYVLGTLDAAERDAAERRRTRDAAFDGLITQWESRLAPLTAAAPSVAPPSELLALVLARLGPERDATPIGRSYANDNVVMLRSRLRLWRTATVATGALAAALALWIVSHDLLPSPPHDTTYVAVLQHGGEQPSFVVSLDLANHRMAVIPLATNAPPGKSYELWMIGGDKATPRSMGIIDATGPVQAHLPDVAPVVLSKATYAVTLEQQGGSPTGQPTGSPLFVGKLMNTSL